MSAKYDPDTSHWDEDEDDHPPRWAEETSHTTEIVVTLHDEGYQTDRKWTVHVSGKVHDEPETVTAGWAEEHTNKGNYWREPRRWEDAIDFVDLPRPVRERVAAVLNRDLDAITPDERTIHRDDGTGIADRETVGQCDVCGGDLAHPHQDRHPDCEVTE